MSFRSLFQTLKPQGTHTFFQQPRRGPPRRRPATSRLAIETLENRCMMAAASMASLAVSDATIVEGNGGIQYVAVNVSMSAPSTKTVQVNYNTADGTAKAGSDYNAASGTLAFAPGQTSKAILVPVTGDRIAEINENFVVNLRGAKGAKIADGQGVVTIVDDEPRISVIGKYASVSDSGSTPATLTVSLSAAYDQAVTVNFATQDGTALAGRDYLATSGTLTFAPGETTKTITVDIVGRTNVLDYRFYVNLSNPSPNALLISDQFVVTINRSYIYPPPIDQEPGPYGYIDPWQYGPTPGDDINP